jgi:hypothetical protein
MSHKEGIVDFRSFFTARVRHDATHFGNVSDVPVVRETFVEANIPARLAQFLVENLARPRPRTPRRAA